MPASRRGLFSMAVVLFLAGATAFPAAPPPKPGDIQEAIRKGVEYLWSRQLEDGSWCTEYVGTVPQPLAPTSAACYALMECRIPPGDVRLRRSLRWLRRSIKDRTYGPGGDSTYTLGFRCQAWLLAETMVPGTYLDALRRDVDLIAASTPSGGYDYLCTGKPEYTGASRPDNSNSQYALYGAWAGKNAQVAVPREYWEKVLRWWLDGQGSDGGWDYMKRYRSSRITMAAAGLASLYVCFDALYGLHFRDVGQEPPPVQAAIDRGLAYIDANFKASLSDPSQYHVGGWCMYYHLFGIQRVGLASGRKRFGGEDWYRLGARVLLDQQRPDGSWPKIGRVPGEVITSWALMFLARGHRPLPFVHLRYGSGWNNRPHAMSNLLAYMHRSLEQPFRQQVVSFSDPEADLLDSKVLLITGHEPPTLDDGQVRRLKNFVRGGGMLFSCAEGSGQGFRAGIRTLYEKMFPGHVLAPLGQDHVLYSVHSRISGRIRFHGITEGSQLLVIHSDDDLTGDWQVNGYEDHPLAFEAGTNIYVYALVKASPGGTGGASTQPAAESIDWLSLDHEDLQRAGEAGKPLREALRAYKEKLLEQERFRNEAIRAARAEAAKALGPAIKIAAEAGKVKDATALLAIRAQLDKGEMVDFGQFASPEVRAVHGEYQQRVLTEEDAYEVALKRARDAFQPRIEAGRERVRPFLSKKAGSEEQPSREGGKEHPATRAAPAANPPGDLLRR